MTVELWSVDWPQGAGAPCFGLVVLDGVVHEAAPIARWAEGKPILVVRRWYVEKGAKVELVSSRSRDRT